MRLESIKRKRFREEELHRETEREGESEIEERIAKNGN